MSNDYFMLHQLQHPSESNSELRSSASRKYRILVTHSKLSPSAVSLLNENDVDVFFIKPYTPASEVADLAGSLNIDGLIVRQGKVDARVIAASPNLRIIAKHGVGVDNIDLAAAAQLGIPVARAVGSNELAVAEHTIALSLCLLKDIPFLTRSTKSGEWLKTVYTGRDIENAQVGLIGFGAIGQHAARLFSALGARVMAFDPYQSNKMRQLQITEASSLDQLLAVSDIVSLHCPLTRETKHLMNKERIAMMKSDGILINTARGGLIDEVALAEALETGVIHSAGLDTLASEPPSSGETRLFACQNLVVTPHVAGVTTGSSRRMAEIAARHVLTVLNGGTLDRSVLADPQTLAVL